MVEVDWTEPSCVYAWPKKTNKNFFI
jgi:hypothetical protein